ncbi:MAG: hypothetical protein KGK07_12915 [Chloroflexota bacterium]|nr:hypothetical protein [Chloroflexota bacterium]
MATCSGCGAMIVWHETKDGKRAPFDALQKECPRCGGAGCEKCEGGKVWITHFATCPGAAAFRRAKP